MKSRFYFFLLALIFAFSCASTQKEVRKGEENVLYTVKVINESIDKASLRYETGNGDYTFRFVDQTAPENVLKFQMNGNLTVQYSLKDYDDAKIIKIKQDTLIHIKQNDIIIDDLPQAEKIQPKVKSSPGVETKSEKKVLEKTK